MVKVAIKILCDRCGDTIVSSEYAPGPPTVMQIRYFDLRQEAVDLAGARRAEGAIYCQRCPIPTVSKGGVESKPQ